MSLRNQEVRLIQRPQPKPEAKDFSLVDSSVKAPGTDEVLVQVDWLSMDPYMHERACSNAMGPIVPLDTRMIGRGIGVVLEGALPAGTVVRGDFGWQRFATVRAADVMVIPESSAPATWHLSVLGPPGLSAWIGLHDCLLHNQGDIVGKTILISSAAGTVGSVAAQLAQAMGLKVVGIAGGSHKCKQLAQLGLHGVIDRLAVSDWQQAISQAAPQGIDFYFDNVGGHILEAAVQCANPRARILLCGHAGEYDGYEGRLRSADILYKRLTLLGFLVWEYASEFARAGQALAQAIKAGQLSLQETIHHGLDQAPAALRAMLDGDGIGKHLVKVS